MPIGANRGGNLNIFLFEVGFIDVTDPFGSGVPFTVSIHPLLVAPKQISYTDSSRSSIVQTSGGSVKITSGRALRNVNMNGTFGVESRGLATYIGTGEVRFRRFYNEVVRMGEALSNDDVSAATDLLRGTPFINLFLLPYDPEKHVPYINFYDFWNERQFSITVGQWSDRRSHNQGGATGLVHYQMTLQEEGPIVTGSLGSALIGALFNGLSTWKAFNDVIKSYTVGVILSGATGLVAIAVNLLTQPLIGMRAQLDSLTALVGGFNSPILSTGLVSVFSNALALADAANNIHSATAAALSAESTDDGAIDWAFVPNDGSSAALDLADELADLDDLTDAALWQISAGSLFGWSREEYQAFVTGQSEGGRGNDIAGSFRYVVGPTDTEDSLVQRFSIAWDRILEVSGLTPDEALLEGAVLSIPRSRGRGNQSIEGLPTFGSHVGQSAYGKDLRVDLAANDGRIVVLEGKDVMIQGVDWLISIFSEGLIPLLNRSPEQVRERLLRLKLERNLLSDKRISGINDISVELNSATAVAALSVTLSAINGATIKTGTPRIAS